MVAPPRQRPKHVRSALRAIAAADLAAYRTIRTRLRSRRVERAAKAYTRLGEHAAVWLAIGAAGAVLDRPRRGRWARAAGTVAGAYVVNTALKLVVRRRRPHLEELPPLIATPTRLSWPSAHATSSFAAARAYGALIPAPPLYAAAISMTWTRVYLGVHFPSDVAAGMALGTLVGSAGR